MQTTSQATAARGGASSSVRQATSHAAARKRPAANTEKPSSAQAPERSSKPSKVLLRVKSTPVSSTPVGETKHPAGEPENRLGLTPEQVAILLGKIRAIRSEALATLSQFKHQGADPGSRTDHHGDEVDRANASSIQIGEGELLIRARRKLKEAEAAIARIESGEYGWCEETGDPIGYRRLLANPLARLCLEAQERLEARQRLLAA